MNVLIVDGPGEFGAFAKSILLGERHRVSLSRSHDDALLKINTALFDAVVCTPSEFTSSLLQYITLECPYLPAVLIGADPQGAAALENPSMVVRCVERPIRVGHFSKTIRDLEVMYRQQLTMMNRKLDVPMEIRCGPEVANGRAMGISLKGILLGNPDRGSTVFHEFFARHRQEECETSLPLDDQRRLNLHGRVTFTETSVDDTVQKVGLGFELADKAEKKTLMEWIGI